MLSFRALKEKAEAYRPYLTSPTPLDPDGLHGLSSPRGGYLIVSFVLNPYTGVDIVNPMMDTAVVVLREAEIPETRQHYFLHLTHFEEDDP